MHKYKIIKLLKSPLFIIEIFITSSLLYLVLYWQNILSVYNDSFVYHTPAGDVLFNIIPKIDLSLLYFGGMFLIIIIGILYTIIKIPEKIPQIILAYSFFFLIRSLCISSTHIGIPPDHITPRFEYFNFLHFFDNDLFFRNDLFFSGHTGVPFLAALFLWRDKLWRNILLSISLIMAFTVISMRIHYTIDIIGAYFITYGIYSISCYTYSYFSSFFIKYQNEIIKNKKPKDIKISAPVSETHLG
jgi:hypothetical protein